MDLCNGKLVPKNYSYPSSDFYGVLTSCRNKAETLGENWVKVYDDGDQWLYIMIWMNKETGEMLECVVPGVGLERCDGHWDDDWSEGSIEYVLERLYMDKKAVNNILKYAKKDYSKLLARLEKQYGK